MKKRLLILLSAFALGSAQAQTEETVSVGAGYANQVYYSLENGEVANNKLDAWDLAFDVSLRGAVVKFNAATGATLSAYPKGDISSWNSIDTTGIEDWQKLYDTDTSWNTTAFNRISSGSPFDLGWGQYSTITHAITGDSLYLLKTANGKYKKLAIDNLKFGTYNLRIGNLDDNVVDSVKIKKSDYATKSFVYYSIKDKQIKDLEPNKADWDLVFTKYTTELGPDLFYGVTGVLSNSGVEVQEVDSTTYDDAVLDSAEFSSDINIIGFNWKKFSRQTFSYSIDTTTVYFVKDKAGEVWRVGFIGFGGSSTGDIVFKSVKNRVLNLFSGISTSNSITLFPNPSFANDKITISSKTGTLIEYVSINTLTGSVVYEGTENEINSLESGIYIVSVITNDGKSSSQKLIVE